MEDIGAFAEENFNQLESRRQFRPVRAGSAAQPKRQQPKSFIAKFFAVSLNPGRDDHVPAEISARPGQSETMGKEVPILGQEKHNLGFVSPGAGAEHIHSLAGKPDLRTTGTWAGFNIT